ncbi:MAG TPA: mannitol dehydrogenase family protein [Gaiellaceae bacterium]|nr:mannitol dehydrogenase family protein [Gaiellaceae bacterium]
MTAARPLSPPSRTRLVHLGLGNFFRAHQAWYTDHAPDAAEWRIAAFTGRSRGLTDALAAQKGLYTLVTRAADRDRFELVGSLGSVHAAEDEEAWLHRLRAPEVAAVTITITEAGYRDGPAIGRLLAGLAARRDADAGPLALVPCDNVPGNGAFLEQLLLEKTDPALAAWIAESVSTVTTVVDRITPRTEPDDLLLVARETGFADRAPVVTEPFSEWILSGAFPGGRPRWEGAGATFADEIEPFEERKLWLLNGGHSLLAYAGSARGHSTVAEAVADEACRGWLEQWWEEASTYVRMPARKVAAYRAALLERWENPRIRHRLGQIAADGSQKLPVRILPVLRRERAAGLVPEGATRALAAWVCHLRGLGAAVDDVCAAELVPLAAGPLPQAARRLLDALDPAIAEDDAVVTAVVAQAEQLAS